MTDFSSQLQMGSNIRIEVGSWPHKISTTIRPSQISFMTKRPNNYFRKRTKWALLEINTYHFKNEGGFEMWQKYGYFAKAILKGKVVTNAQFGAELESAKNTQK